VRLASSVNAAGHAGAGLGDLRDLPPPLGRLAMNWRRVFAAGRLLKSGN